jgi:hypothetical protein
MSEGKSKRAAQQAETRKAPPKPDEQARKAYEDASRQPPSPGEPAHGE